MNELIKALEIIKAECNKEHDCADCPIGNENRCMIINDIPAEWNINTKKFKALIQKGE